MKPDEKRGWIAQLWVSSAGLMLMLGVTLGSDDGIFAPTIVAFAWFGGVLIAWLFRITYLAGKKSH